MALTATCEKPWTLSSSQVHSSALAGTGCTTTRLPYPIDRETHDDHPISMMTIPLKVLISEDQEDDALLIVDELSQNGYQVDWKRIETAAEMRAALLEQAWDLI